jgi:hypothetical protein
VYNTFLTQWYDTIKYIKKGVKMLEFLKRRLKSEKGAMDKILVTLLLVVIGVAAVIGLANWMDTESDKMTDAATTSVDAVIAGS